MRLAQRASPSSLPRRAKRARCAGEQPEERAVDERVDREAGKRRLQGEQPELRVNPKSAGANHAHCPVFSRGGGHRRSDRVANRGNGRRRRMCKIPANPSQRHERDSRLNDQRAIEDRRRRRLQDRTQDSAGNDGTVASPIRMERPRRRAESALDPDRCRDPCRTVRRMRRPPRRFAISLPNRACGGERSHRHDDGARERDHEARRGSEQREECQPSHDRSSGPHSAVPSARETSQRFAGPRRNRIGASANPR